MSSAAGNPSSFGSGGGGVSVSCSRGDPRQKAACDLGERLLDVHPERAQIRNGRDGEREVARIDGAAHGETEALDRRFGAAHLLEQPARDDQRARDRGVTFDDRRAPPQCGFGLVRQEKRQCAVDGRIRRLGAGQIRRRVLALEGPQRITPSGSFLPLPFDP
jgi:hypothetical protein